MLVLSRKLHETIVIDGGIEITPVEITKYKVRLSIKAPKNVRVLREELLDRTDEDWEGDNA